MSIFLNGSINYKPLYSKLNNDINNINKTDLVKNSKNNESHSESDSYNISTIDDIYNNKFKIFKRHMKRQNSKINNIKTKVHITTNIFKKSKDKNLLNKEESTLFSNMKCTLQSNDFLIKKYIKEALYDIKCKISFIAIVQIITLTFLYMHKSK